MIKIARGLAMASILATLASSQESLAATSEQLVIGTTENLEDFSQFTQDLGESEYVRNLVAPPLVAVGAKWTWRCHLCKELPSLEKGTLRVVKAGDTERLESDWEILDKYHWGDGAPVTGHDVRIALTAHKLSLGSPAERDAYPIIKVTVDQTEPRRFTITFRKVRSDYFELLALSLMPSHLVGPAPATIDPKREDKRRKRVARLEALYLENPTQAGFYYGTYRPEKLAGKKLILQRNEAYKGKAAAYDRIELRHFDSESQLLRATYAREVSMVPGGVLGLASIEELETKLKSDDALRGQVKVVETVGDALEQIIVNLRNPTFADANLRQALLLGINRARLVEKVYHGRAIIAEQLVHPRDAYDVAPSHHYDYDPPRARELLEGMGWIASEDGVRAKNGTRLAFELVTTDDPERASLVEQITDDWRAIGVSVTKTAEARSHFFQTIVAEARFADLALLSWVRMPGAVFWTGLHSHEIPTSDNHYRGQNTGGYVSKDADRLLEAIAEELDRDERRKLVAQLMSHYTADLPTLPLVFKPKFAVIPRDLDNFFLPGHAFHESLYVANWQIATKAGARL